MRFVQGALTIAALLIVAVSGAFAEPCLMAYPDGPSIYHYESAENYTVGPGHPLYDPAYDRGGEVLIDLNSNEIAYEIYQAAGMVGFELDEENQGWFFQGTQMDLILDGWANQPYNYTNVTLVFRAIAEPCQGYVLVNGLPAIPQPDGSYHMPVGDLAVSTPTPNGNAYSDAMTIHLEWSACLEIDIWAWADENYDGIKQGDECFTAFSKNTTVPVLPSTVGEIKASFDE